MWLSSSRNARMSSISCFHTWKLDSLSFSILNMPLLLSISMDWRLKRQYRPGWNDVDGGDEVDSTTTTPVGTLSITTMY